MDEGLHRRETAMPSGATQTAPAAAIDHQQSDHRHRRLVKDERMLSRVKHRRKSTTPSVAGLVVRWSRLLSRLVARTSSWCCAACIGLSFLSFVLMFSCMRTIAMAKVIAAVLRPDSWEGGPIDFHAAAARVASSGDSRRTFTVLVNTFERPRQLENAVRHYAQCDGFIPPEGLATDAVFVVDDDIAVPCDHLLAAFGTWQRHPDTLVGFFPRSHAHELPSQGKADAGMWEYLYFWRVLWTMQYSIVLTKAAFVHAKYLELYSGVSVLPHEAPYAGVDGGSEGGGIQTSGHWGTEMAEAMAQTRAYVDSHRNCEDIAMQMAVTAVSGLTPVTAFAPVVDIGNLGGISAGEGSGKWWQAPHALKRSRCIGDLHDIFCSQGAIASIAEPSIGATIHTPPPTQPPAGMRRADEGVPKQSSAPTKQAEPRCESALVYTNLFAIPPTLSPTNRLSPPSRLRGGNVPGAHGGSAVGVDDIGNMGSTGAWGSDLSRLSRWGLAIRAPTLAEFISADMLLVPGKIWKWFAEDDILGRKLQ